MGRAPCCDRASVKRGPWSPEEDAVLINYVEKNGTGGNWIALPRKAGLKRCGKSCRLRWLNYLRPDIKHGGFTEEENSVICDLYNKIGSRWSVIASRLPGRTDNDVKNYWNTKLKKKMMAGQIALPHATVASTSTTHIYHSPSLAPPPQPPLLAAIKTEDHSGSANFSVPLEKGLSTNFSYSHEPYKLCTGMTQFPMAASVTPSEDISAASSVDNNSSSNGYSNWSTNGVGGDDAFFSELGFGPTSDFFGGYGSQERTGVVSPSYYSNLSDMWATNETKPQELYQSVTYT